MIVSFGYDSPLGVPKADRIIDIRDLPHSFRDPRYTDRIRQLQREYTRGETWAVGCQAGQHRSPALVEELSKRLGVSCRHRDRRTPSKADARLMRVLKRIV